MTELEFTQKPRRMTSPPQNQRKWLPGYEGVEVVMETHPARIAYFARECTWGDVMREPTNEELQDTLAEVQAGKVLGAAFKGGIGFRIRASRSCMDQMLRLAEGSGGAGSGAGAQTTRDNDHRDFNVIVPNTIEALNTPEGTHYYNEGLYQRVKDLMFETRRLYGDLVDAGIPPQDARYVALPLGFQTQWFHVMSLGNMIKMCEQRMCNGLTQHETNYLVRVMRDMVVKEYPWMADNLRSGCEKRGKCASSTMLFPPCGAFTRAEAEQEERIGAAAGEEWSHADVAREEERIRLLVTKYNPDKHLYPTEQNDAMQFALWDIQRQKLEAERPEAIFSMAGEPELIGFKVSSSDG